MTFGVGVIGCGHISAAYMRLAPMFNGIEMRACADRQAAVATARAAEFGLRAETVDRLLAAEDIDIVVNLTIPEAHFDVTRRCLAAGKHVYSEKPFALTLEHAAALRDLAADKGLRLGSAPDTFLGGAHQLARAVLDDGQAGDILSGTCHVMSRGMEHWHPNPDFFFQPGAGPVLDIGPYYVTNLIQLLGPVASVASMVGQGFATRRIGSGPRAGEVVAVDTPTSIHALLQFHNGSQITLGASWDVPAHGHAPMELYGTKATLMVPDPNFFGGTVRLATPEDETVVPGRDHPFERVNETDQSDRVQANYRGAGLADMARAIADNRPHRCSEDLALHAVEVMTAILDAGARRSWVDLTTTCARPAPLTPGDAAALLADDAHTPN